MLGLLSNEERPVARIKRQNYFGGFALVEDSKRLYSLWAEQDCHLFYFTRKDYEEMLAEEKKRAENEKIQFLSKIPPFNTLSRSQLKKFSQSLKQMSLQRLKYLYRQGDPADYVYIVREGDFAVTLRYEVQGPSYFDTNQMEVFESPDDAKRKTNPFYIKNNKKVLKSFKLSTI